MTQVRVTCSRCAGTGQVAHRTARYDARCFCCGGSGFYFRKASTKRVVDGPSTIAARAEATDKALHELAARLARGET
jgi:DnaJ-class molecular chaperone